jgi:hypothetical protein
VHIVVPIFSHVAFEAAQLSPFGGSITYVVGVALGNTSVPPFWHTSVAVAVAVFWVLGVVPGDAARSTTTGPAAAAKAAAAAEERKIIIELEEEETLGAGGWRTCGKWVVAGVCEWVRRFMISQKN